MNADKANDTVDAARQLQRALYRAAKASTTRRFHALYNKVYREGVSTGRNRLVAQGNAESGAMKDLGKPDEGEPHVRFDEGRLETGLGLGTAAPAKKCVDSAGPPRPPRQPPTLPR